jgi:hypothetical protein
MPIDLIGAVVAWLVAASGDAGIRLIRGSGDEGKLRKAVRVAVEAVVREVDPALQKQLRAGLILCFSSPPAMKLDGTTPTGDWLRSAIVTQVSQLEGWVNNDTGRPFYQDVPVDPAWLSGRVTDAIVGALRQVVASGNLPELVRGVDTTDVLGRLDALGLLGQQTAARLKAIEQSVGLRNQAVATAALAPEEYQEAFLKLYKVPHYDLAGILPYMAGHVTSAIVMVPAPFEGHRLKDADLQFIRQDLQVSVVALRHEGDAEWMAGGAVSETPLTERAELLVCGPKLAIAKLRAQFGGPESEAVPAPPRSSPK